MVTNDEWLKVRFEIQKGQRYHDKRLGFNEASSHWAASIAIILAVASIYPTGTVVAVASTVSLIAAILILRSRQHWANHHLILRNKYINLDSEFIGLDPDNDDIVELRSKLMIVEGQDRNRMPVSDLDAYNQVVRAYSEFAHLPMYTVPWHRRFSAASCH